MGERGSGGRAPPRTSSTASNRPSWSAVYGFPGSSATARWVHTPARVSSSSRDVHGQRHRFLRSAAHADHAGVDLEVHVERLGASGVGNGLRRHVDPQGSV